jgi:hypothetical protein
MTPKHAGAVPIVFLSSTAEDLQLYRAAARDGAAKARFLPEMQEYWVARDHPPLDECLDRVSQADVLVVIVAYRYGWVPEDQPGGGAKSITWLEVERAVGEDKEVLAFVVDERAEWPDKSKEEYALVEAVREGRAVEAAATVQRNVEQLRKFKEWLNGRAVRETFTNPEDLRGKVQGALRDWLDRHPEFGPPGLLEPPPEPDATRYLEALREETAHIEIRGLQAAEGRAYRFPIEDLYIPLVNETGRGGGDRMLPGGQEAVSAETSLDDALGRRGW